MTTKQTAIVKTGLDATLNMEDIANVYLARYEESLMARQEETRKQVQAITKNKEALQKTVEADARTFVQTKLAGLIAPLNSGLISFAVNDEVHINGEVVYVHVTQTTALSDELKLVDHHYYRRGTGATSNPTSEFQVEVAIAKEHLEQAAELDKEHAAASAILQETNNQLVNIGRKERQVKAMISQKKLEELGQADLINLPEVNALLQLK